MMAGPRTSGPPSADVIVIGAGHNGLVAACYLARSGVDVLVVEAAEKIGGMTSTGRLISEAPDHLINPCAIDVIFLQASSIDADLDLRRYGYQPVPLDPGYVHVDADGGSIAHWRDPARTAEEIARFCRSDARTYVEFARATHAILDMFLPMMLADPMRPSPAAVFSTAAQAVQRGRHVRMLSRLMTSSAAEVVDELFTHPMTKGLLSVLDAVSSLTAPGSGPLLLTSAVVSRFGLSRLAGGTQNLPDSLARCLAAAGGQVRTNAAVHRLLVDGGRVRGVVLADGEELTADAVIAACDVKQTLTKLLPDGVLEDHHAARAAHIPVGSGGAATFKVDVALRGRLNLRKHEMWRGDGLDLRRPGLTFGSLGDINRAFARAAAGDLADPLPFLSAVPSAVDASQAPDGQDTFYLWMNWAPAEPADGWEDFKPVAAKAALAQAGLIYGGIEELEIGRRIEAWPDLEARLGATRGNVVHVDFGLDRIGPFRPARGFGGYQTPVPGLFLSGAGTHPSPGVVGIPGQLAARRVAHHLKKNR